MDKELKEECILVFQTTHRTLQAENILKKEKIKIKIVLKPRSITTDCGLAIRFNAEDKDVIFKIIKNNNLSLMGVYSRSGEKWIKL
ncbi:MAG: DUF3343 domain-containing protein [bacterium]|nr:DUF3343 domain-containing protein [bacterium]